MSEQQQATQHYQQWEDFSNKRVALLGAGKENLSLIPHLSKAGAQITLCDKSTDKNYISKLEEIPAVELVLGERCLDDLDKYDVIFRTPGLPLAEVASALKGLKRLPYQTSAVDFFLALKPAIIVGVTGTKGKGTTAVMLSRMLKSTNRKVVVAGNIGTSIYDQLNELTSETVVIMELSSFQLEDISHSPEYAIVLSIGEDHLQPLSERSPNYHRSMSDYITAKQQITAHQNPSDLLVYSSDSDGSRQIGESSPARTISVSMHGKGTVRITSSGELVTGRAGVIDLSKTGLRGDHILFNAAMAATMALELGVTADAVVEGLSNFKPLPHRLELIGEFDGISFVDDSYATTPEATIAALSAYDQPIVLIAGGSRKGASFDSLAAMLVAKSVKALILLGEEAPRIEEAVAQTSFIGQVIRTDSIELAVQAAKDVAVTGDVVLLSPGCASKDMFTDAAERGTRFAEAARGHN